MTRRAVSAGLASRAGRPQRASAERPDQRLHVDDAEDLAAAYLSVYATRVTVTTSGRTTGSDGITLRLTRSGRRWLVSAVLFY